MTVLTTETPISNQARALASFAKETTEHEMTILHDDGLYRHLRFQKPGTRMFGYDVVTWPGHVSITGDMGDSVLARDMDMLNFLAGPDPLADGSISFSYFAEKVVANSGSKEHWNPQFLEEHLRGAWLEHCESQEVSPDSPEAINWWESLKDKILNASDDWGNSDEHAQREALSHWESSKKRDFTGVRLSDTWEWDCKDLDYHLYWRLIALRVAANRYFAATEGDK